MTNKVYKKNTLNVISILEEFQHREDYPAMYAFACGIKTDSSRIVLQLTKRKFRVGKYWNREDTLSERRLKKMKNKPLKLYGKVGEQIPENAYEQMQEVMKMAPVVKGALLPDAHLGYSMPIGGVAALSNAISPALVGRDIGCTVMLTILNMEIEDLEPNKTHFYLSLSKCVNFGVKHGYKNTEDNIVFDNPLWKENRHVKELLPQAIEQLGTSGRGNHFADIVVGERISDDEEFNHIPDKFVALMTHSGSRGVGFKLAGYYMALAEANCEKLSSYKKGYGWLDMDKDSGKEYFDVMKLMGDYSIANHKLIQEKFLNMMNMETLGVYTSMHNFAWKEGKYYIHRKGAIPAHDKRFGVIPGSSGSSSYLVRGLGSSESLDSASHGAGRKFSRKEAKKLFDLNAYIDKMQDDKIMTNNLHTDESYQAYKDIEEVIEIQKDDLIEVVAKMEPKIVIMDSPETIL